MEFGELMLSLSYLPTAERLTLILTRARRLPNPTDFNIFIKVINHLCDLILCHFHNVNISAGLSSKKREKSRQKTFFYKTQWNKSYFQWSFHLQRTTTFTVVDRTKSYARVLPNRIGFLWNCRTQKDRPYCTKSGRTWKSRQPLESDDIVVAQTCLHVARPKKTAYINFNNKYILSHPWCFHVGIMWWLTAVILNGKDLF